MPATVADGFYPSSQSSSARVNRPFRRDESNLDYPLSHTISVVSSVSKVRTLQTRIPFVTLVSLRLETSRCNGVPAFCPVFSGLQTGSRSLSPACQISLGALGKTPSLKSFSPPRVVPLRASQRTGTASWYQPYVPPLWVASQNLSLALRSQRSREVGALALL